MFFRRCGVPLLLLLLSCSLTASATTTLDAFSDAKCESLVGIAYAVDGDVNCEQLPGVKSVRTTHSDTYCAVTVYSDNSCSNDATLAPLDRCVAMSSINSLSVDCQLPDGSWESPNPSQTASFQLTSLSSVQASASGLSDSSSSFSSSFSPSPSSSLSPTSVASIPPASSSSSTTSSAAANTSLSSSSTKSTTPTSILSVPSVQKPTTPSSVSSSSSPTLVVGSRTTSLVSTSTTDPPPASSTTATTQAGGIVYNNGNLSANAQIAIGVVVPAVSVIVAVVFGVRMWHRRG